MKNSVEYRNDLSGIVDRMQAIHDRATRENNRSLSRTERADWNRLNAEAAALRAKIDAQELLENTPLSVDSPDIRSARALLGYTNSASRTVWQRDLDASASVPTAARRDGDIRVLGPRDSLVDLYRNRWDSDLQPEHLSMTRWVNGIMTGDWSHAPAEYKATMSGTQLAGGGVLVPEPLSAQMIELVRAQSIAFRLGAMLVPMESSSLKFARQASDPTSAWRTENQAITSSDLTFEGITLDAKTLACYTKMSIELFEDALGIEDVVMTAMSQSLALELDRAVFLGQSNGVGPIEPLGIVNVHGVNSTNLAAGITVDALLAAMGRLWANNIEADGLAWSPSTRSTFEQLKDGDGEYLSGKLPAVVQALNKQTSSQIPSTTAIIGRFSDLMIGVRTQVTTEFTRYGSDGTDRAFAQLQVHGRGYMRADSYVRHEKSFEVLTGLV